MSEEHLVSAWFFISVNGATAKESRVRTQLAQCGVHADRVHRVQAVTEVRTGAPGESELMRWWRGRKSSQFSVSGISVILEKDLPLTAREVNVLLSHLSAARTAYDEAQFSPVEFTP